MCAADQSYFYFFFNNSSMNYYCSEIKIFISEIMIIKKKKKYIKNIENKHILKLNGCILIKYLINIITIVIHIHTSIWMFVDYIII